MEPFEDDKILLAHGSGGKLGHDLVEKGFLPSFDNPLLSKLDDSAVFDARGRMAFTTDSYIVTPIFFPGGDIGKLAVCGHGQRRGDERRHTPIPERIFYHRGRFLLERPEDNRDLDSAGNR